MHRILFIVSFFLTAAFAAIILFIYPNTYFVENISSSNKNEEQFQITEDLETPTSTEKIILKESEPKIDDSVPQKEEVVEEFTEEPVDIIEIVIPEPTPEPVVVEEVLPPVEELTIKEELTFGEINIKTRESLVNIFCLTTGYHADITPISGSGTIIDERGVILTNAHIAQYFLLENYPTEGFVNCLIRTGSPAKAMYKATLLYISPLWISENADAIVTENPVGTGEHDFAFLLINETLNGEPLPETFPFIEPNTEEKSVAREDSILVGAYPAGLLGGKTIQQSLYASTAITTAMEFYTFETGSLDVISLGGTVVAQQGSSGGAVVNKNGKMVGLISTSSGGETTADRDLRAISLSHVERSLIENNNTTFDELLAGNLTQKAAAFNDGAAPTLLQILINKAFNP